MTLEEQELAERLIKGKRYGGGAQHDEPDEDDEEGGKKKSDNDADNKEPPKKKGRGRPSKKDSVDGKFKGDAAKGTKVASWMGYKESFVETNPKFLEEGENLSKLVSYAKVHPELGDAIGVLIKKYISKPNVNLAAIMNTTVKETGVNRGQLLSALEELGFDELVGG